MNLILNQKSTMTNNLDQAYQAIMSDIINDGKNKEDRTGTGTVSLFGKEIRHDMSSGYPLLTTKKMAFKTMVTELLWFLKGDTNIKYLVDNNCNIWNGDAYKKYCQVASSLEEPDYDIHIEDLNENKVRLLTQDEFVNRIKTSTEFAKKWGELGPVYGAQWRRWKTFRSDNKDAIKSSTDSVEYIDQLKNLIKDLKNNPDSRRLMVSAWNPGEMHRMVLPPCHYGFQVYTYEMSEGERMLEWCNSLNKDISYADNITMERLDDFNFPKRKISLIWNQRSADYFLGVPFNIASYGLLLQIIGKMVNMIPDELIGRFGDTHLYKNHLEQAEEQLTRKSYPLPSVFIGKDAEFWRQDVDKIFEGLSREDFHLLNYESNGAIKAPLSN